MEELEKAWGRPWGAQTHTGRLEMVLVHRPGEENEAPEIKEDPPFFNLPKGIPDLKLMQKQHDAFVELLQNHGVEVIYLNPSPPLVGTYGIALRALVFARTGTVIRGGAILDRNANHYKRGMERFYAKRLTEIGCPILYTVHGMGSWEASDIIFVDPKCVIIGMGSRSNEEGFRQIRPILEQAGVEEFIITDLPGYWIHRTEQIGGQSGYFHLDGVFAMVAERVAVVNTAGVGYHALDKLNKRGVDIIEVPEKEAHSGYGAANGLVIAPGEVVVPAGNPETVARIRKKGITVHELDMSALLKGGGGPKCITMPLIQR
jgi:N-dimethylarginine dimethylaminohydrolase